MDRSADRATDRTNDRCTDQSTNTVAIINSARAAVGTPCQNESFRFHCFCFFLLLTFEHQNYENPICSLIFESFFKEQALKPCSGPRSRDSAQIWQIESSPNPNLTDLVKKEGWYFVKTVLAVAILISAVAAVGNAPLWEFKLPQF